MKHVCWALALQMGMALPSAAGTHPVEVEDRLAFLVEDWTIEGAEATYRETCAWYHGRSFVVCQAVDQESRQPEHSVSIFGWSAEDRAFTYHHYGDSGRSRSERCFPSADKGLTCLGERRSAAGLVQTRSSIWPVEGGAAFRSERSVNGGPWTEAARLKYVPRRE